MTDHHNRGRDGHTEYHHSEHQHGRGDSVTAAHHHEPPAGATDLVHCPVMPANLVDPQTAEKNGLYRDYQGSRYWFCCPECGPLWDADPAKYAHAS